MSAMPTTIRAGLACAAAASLMLPAGALAAKPDKADKGKTPAVCDHGLPPGIAKKGGDLPPGIAKKVAGQHPCEGNPQNDPQGGSNGSNGSNGASGANAAPAAAPAATTVASASAPRSCASRRHFRLRLDRKGRVRKARVMLNGRAIPVTRGRKRTSVLIDLRGRRAGTYVVRTTVVTRKGKLHTGTHRYRVCA
jgi:hypothetical protein